MPALHTEAPQQACCAHAGCNTTHGRSGGDCTHSVAGCSGWRRSCDGHQCCVSCWNEGTLASEAGSTAAQSGGSEQPFGALQAEPQQWSLCSCQLGKRIVVQACTTTLQAAQEQQQQQLRPKRPQRDFVGRVRDPTACRVCTGSGLCLCSKCGGSGYIG